MKNSAILEQALVFHKVKNETGTSSAEAPYLGVIELKGVIPHENLVEEIVEEGCSASAETVDLVLKSADAVRRECVGAKGYKVHTGAAIAMPHLTGSLPAPDAGPGEGNELVPRIDLGDGLRLAAADLVPKENREDISGLGGVRILSVFTEGIGFTQLKGTMPFSLAGVGFKPSAASSAAVKVVNAKTGVETEAAEVTVEDNQHIVAQLGSVLPKGDYRVVVTVTDESAAGNRDASYNVKMLAAPLPPPEPLVEIPAYGLKVMSVEPKSGAKLVFGEEWTFRGEGLASFDTSGQGISEITCRVDSAEAPTAYETELSFAADGRTLGVKAKGSAGGLTLGEHLAFFTIECMGAGSESGTFSVPFTVEE